MSKLKFNIRTTKHNGRTAWAAYVITNAKRVEHSYPLQNGTSNGRRVVWSSFYAPSDNDTPEAALAKALTKIGEFIVNNVKLPPASEYTSRAHEFVLEVDLGEKTCDCCGQGIGTTTPEVYDK